MTDDATKREYDRLASVYDRRWSGYVRRSVQRATGALRLEGNERVLDVGCGTGALFGELLAIQPHIELHGVDASTAMLEAARRKCGSKAVLVEASAEALPYPDGHFDVVTSVSAMHYFSDVPKAVSEMSRVLRPGGGVVIVDWCADFRTMRIFAAWLRLRKAAFERSHRAAELSELLGKNGFKIDRAKRFRIPPLWGMMLVTGTLKR